MKDTDKATFNFSTVKNIIDDDLEVTFGTETSPIHKVFDTTTYMISVNGHKFKDGDILDAPITIYDPGEEGHISVREMLNYDKFQTEEAAKDFVTGCKGTWNTTTKDVTTFLQKAKKDLEDLLPSEVTVSFDTGTKDVSNPSTQTIAKGGKATSPSVTWAGHTFLGWYNGDRLWDFDDAVNESMTLKARWAEIKEELDVDLDSGGKAQFNVSSDSTVKKIVLKGGSNSVTFDEDSVKLLRGKTLTVLLREANEEDVYELSVKCGNDEFKGKMTVTLQYDKDQGTPRLYIREDGKDTEKDPIKDSDKGTFTFDVNGSSKIVIKYEGSGNNGDKTGLYIGIAIVAVLVVAGIAGYFVYQKKH